MARSKLIEQRMKRWIELFGCCVLVVGGTVTAFGQSLAQNGTTDLAKIKAAAEQGDASAQDKLGDAYRSRFDSVNAEVWYRKAAAQGVAHSQCEVGRILMWRATEPTTRQEARTAAADEAIQWFVKAAHQGDRQACLELGRQYRDGKFIKQDRVEAYKWFALAARREKLIDPASIGGKGGRDAMILEMTQAEISEGKRRADAFVPNQSHKLPEPSWVKEIKLQGIGGSSTNRVAIINAKTFEKDDVGTLKVAGKKIEVRCVAVADKSATIVIAGLDGHRELKLAQE